MYHVYLRRFIYTPRFCYVIRTYCYGSKSKISGSHKENKSKYYRYKPPEVVKQICNNLLVLDFESTCEKNMILKPQEIIEFPCLWLNGENYEVKGQFHQFVRPKHISTLTPFCTELTGIVQEMVDNAPYFDVVLSNFLFWMEDMKVKMAEKDIMFVTSGSWDLQVMLPDQCNLSNLPVPKAMHSWIDVKKAFALARNEYPLGLKDMLRRLNLSHQGRLHSGIDDCWNIVEIVRALAYEGYVFKQTHALQKSEI